MNEKAQRLPIYINNRKTASANEMKRNSLETCDINSKGQH